jgi:protein-S-isoprenylcysteine O-methyltransferase Ste14
MDAPTVLLALAILTVTYLSYRSFTPPNPHPTDTTTRDRLFVLGAPLFLLIRRIVVVALGIYHALLILTVSFPSPSPTPLCPRPENLNPLLFTWSLHSAICISAMLIFGPLRLLAFNNLGPNFTFRIAPPKKLITTGLYRYIQHPSYVGNTVVITINGLLLLRPDGVAACWLKKGWVESKIWIVLGYGSIVGVGFLAMRVRDEERMLKKAFGKEWEQWHAKTARFIPGVF